jgi:hypothetical protein
MTLISIIQTSGLQPGVRENILGVTRKYLTGYAKLKIHVHIHTRVYIYIYTYIHYFVTNIE